MPFQDLAMRYERPSLLPWSLRPQCRTLRHSLPHFPPAEAFQSSRENLERAKSRDWYLPLLGGQPEDFGNSFARKGTYKNRNY